MIRRRTIRARLTLWYMLLLGLSLVIFSVALYGILNAALSSEIDSGLRLAVGQARGQVEPAAGQVRLKPGAPAQAVTALGDRGLLVRIRDTGGGVVLSAGPYPALPIPAEASRGADPAQGRFLTVEVPGGGAYLRLYTVPVQDGGHVVGFITVGQSLGVIQVTLGLLLVILAGALPITLGLAGLGGLWLARRALTPIDRLTRTVQQIGAAALDRRLDLDLPDDEVGRLARTFDMMLARLDDAFRRQRQFTADAAHELRTPLAIMKGDIGVALHRPRSAPEYQRALAGLEDEVDRLTRLVEDLLLLARADSGQPLLQVEPLDLVDLLEVVADQVQPLAAAKNLTLCLELPARLPWAGDPDKLLRLFLNLLDNAVKYTPAGGEVRVHAPATSPEGYTIAVTDTGPGIALDQQAGIFARFYRADTARSRATGGAGLGLALARWIVEAHGGRLTVRSAPGQGSTFRVWLPPPAA